MQLSIYTKTGGRVVNLTEDFFTTTKVIRRGVPEFITPSAKAKDFAEDAEGKNLVGYELRRNGRFVSQSNMEVVRALKAKVTTNGRDNSCTAVVPAFVDKP